MSNKRFVIKMIINAVALMISTLIMFLIFENTVITNDIALGQMNNSNEAYLLMEYYNRIRTIASSVYGGICAYIAGITIYDIYNFVNNKGEN